MFALSFTHANWEIDPKFQDEWAANLRILSQVINKWYVMAEEALFCMGILFRESFATFCTWIP